MFFFFKKIIILPKKINQLTELWTGPPCTAGRETLPIEWSIPLAKVPSEVQTKGGRFLMSFQLVIPEVRVLGETEFDVGRRVFLPR